MTITQDTAILIDTLASAASKIGSTEASAELLKRIEELADTDTVTIPVAEFQAYQTATENAEAFRAQLIRLAEINQRDLSDSLELGDAEAFQAILEPWAPTLPA